MDLMEVGCDNEDWIHLGLLAGLHKSGEILGSQAAVNVSRRTVLYGVRMVFVTSSNCK
jgi:hypothetical protein